MGLTHTQHDMMAYVTAKTADCCQTVTPVISQLIGAHAKAEQLLLIFILS